VGRGEERTARRGRARPRCRERWIASRVARQPAAEAVQRSRSRSRRRAARCNECGTRTPIGGRRAGAAGIVPADAIPADSTRSRFRRVTLRRRRPGPPGSRPRRARQTAEQTGRRSAQTHRRPVVGNAWSSQHTRAARFCRVFTTRASLYGVRKGRRGVRFPDRRIIPVFLASRRSHARRGIGLQKSCSACRLG